MSKKLDKEQSVMKNKIYSLLLTIVCFSSIHAMEKTEDLQNKPLTTLKIAIIGGRNDMAEKLYGKKEHGYFLIDNDKDASADLTHDINQKLPINYDNNTTFDRVIFENVHVNTFNEIAIQNGIKLLNKNGILSMSAFPEFFLISEEQLNAFQYEKILPQTFAIKVFEKNKKYDTLAFYLYKRLQSTLGGEKNKWEFASLSSKTDDILELDDKNFAKELKGSISTGSFGSNSSKSEDYDITGRYIQYNDQENLRQIRSYLNISEEYDIKFDVFDKTTWVSQISPSKNFGFFVTKTKEY